MLRIVQSGNSLPFSWPVDPNAEFQPGQIAQLNVYNQQIVCGVSDGSAPIGIIDDIKTHAFFTTAIDEVIIVPTLSTTTNNTLVSAVDIKTELENPHITARSFQADIEVELNAKNGVITIPAGTPLNFDQEGTGTPDSVRVVVSYSYQVPNIPGDDSTQGSGRVTVWFQRIIFQTDQFETNQRYPVGSNLFVSESGLLTTRQPSADHSAVALCTAPPTSIHGALEALWV